MSRQMTPAVILEELEQRDSKITILEAELRAERENHQKLLQTVRDCHIYHRCNKRVPFLGEPTRREGYCELCQLLSRKASDAKA